MPVIGSAGSVDNKTEFFDHFETVLAEAYPETHKLLASEAGGIHSRISTTLLSPHTVPIARSTIDQATHIVQAFDRLRLSEPYIKDVCARSPYPREADPGNRGALMSFDFHLADDGRLRLIEINTNASLSLVGDLCYRAQKIANPCDLDFCKDIVDVFRSECLASRLSREPKWISIVDRDPPTQRLYAEFLLFRELFAHHGIHAQILDSAAACDNQTDLIYLRDVDFALSTPESSTIKNAFLNGSACVTPNPFEYQLMADKDRLLELGNAAFLERVLPGQDNAAARDIIRLCLLKAISVSSQDPDALWADRKKWFFKPARAYGGKAAYRGSSIGRKAFESLFHGDFIAQEYAPPPVLSFKDGAGRSQDYKYDLRFFAYRDRCQLGIARLYQGQMTNARTPGGGVACLVVV